MEKPRLGQHLFREKPTKDRPHQPLLLCLVTGLNLDGTVTLIAFSSTGEASVYGNAHLVQCKDESPPHYAECVHKLNPDYEKPESC